MLFKIALKNIKKSIKDYSIYFFTLVIAVAVFYIFNSLDSQTSMKMMTESRYEVVQGLITILSYISVFISIVLGFLIIYSNSFLIKRRKKELGIYLTLGMSKKNVSLVLVFETLLIGVFSLVIGLVLGVFLSQFLSIFTAKLFEINMETLQFVFSISAFLKTIFYFSIIFIFVMIFNVTNLSTNKIINLLTANKRNEKVKFRNKYVIITTFLLSIICLGYAYYLLFDGALVNMDKRMAIMIIFGMIGTYFLFFSLSGFFLKVFQRRKKIYYNKLNMFVLKQISSKANKTVVSTTVICLMLFFTIGILSGSISLMNVMNNDVSSNNLTDITITSYSANNVVQTDGKIVNKDTSYTTEDIRNESYFSNYIKDYAIYYLFSEEDLTMSSLMGKKETLKAKKKYGEGISFNSPIDIMSESDFNDILKLYGKDKIDIDDNHYLLTSNMDKAIEFFKDRYKKGGKIAINNKNLTPETKEIYNVSFKNFGTSSNLGTIIVDDSVIGNLDSDMNILIGNYQKNDNTEKFENEFIDKTKTTGTYDYTTKLQMQDTQIGVKAILTFVGLYLGITFAITSATILAIKELSESSDNKERYKVLKEIGADEKMIKNALFTQILIAFISPLIVAVFHAFFGLRELNGLIELMGDIDLSSSIILTSMFIILVYGGYFVVTYICSKRLMRE